MNIRELFADKVSIKKTLGGQLVYLFTGKDPAKDGIAAKLGKAAGEIETDVPRERIFQRFQHGVVIGRLNHVNSPDDLIVSYGKLYEAWWDQPNANWLGMPLEDPYEASGRDGSIMVQRFSEGVIWCRSDGSGDVHRLSWRDWSAISHPKPTERLRRP